MKENDKKTSAFIRSIVRVGNILEKLLALIGGLSILLFLGAIFADVVSRILGAPLKSCQEIALFAFVWAIFTGSAVAVRYSSHFTIDIAVNALKGLPRKLVDIFDRVAVTLFALVLLVYGWQYSVICLKRFSQPSGICMTVGTVCIVIGAIGMVFYCAEYFLLSVSGTDLQTCKAQGKEAKK